MKFILTISIAIILLLTGCERKPDAAELKIKRRMIIEQMLQNEDISRALNDEASRSNKESSKMIARKNKEIDVWRELFYEQRNATALVYYADSILNRYKSLDNSSDDVTAAITQYRQTVLEGGDSTSILNLIWYTVHAEKGILDDYLSQLASSGTLFWSMFSTETSDGPISVGDTMFVHVTGPRGSEKWDVDFDSVGCKNEHAGSYIRPRVVKTGPHYMLMFIPKEPGTYRLHGPVYLTQGGFREDYPIRANAFVVK